MKTYLPGFVLAASISTLSCVTWANPQLNSNTDLTASNMEQSLARVSKAEAEAKEAKAMADKVSEETRLQEALLKQKMVDTIFKAELEAGLINKAAKKAEAEAQLAAALAAKSEAQLRDIKAKMELKTYEQAGPIHCESKVAIAKYERIESEIKLNKLQQELQSMSPASSK